MEGGCLLCLIYGRPSGILGLVIGLLFSSYGLLMIGATVIAFIEFINEKIKARFRQIRI
ncbi:MAG: CD1845 family protein [Ezakiella sp.]|nr:CD1845 family protein [Ezakiella sp.]